MKDVQQVGGPETEQDVFVGLARQITIDTDNWDIRLHDGVTPGGRLIPNRDNLDDRYQQKLSELNGFGGFAPELKGFWVRTAAGVMTLRQLAVNTAQLQITNPDGVAGNPTIGLKASIAGNYEFTGNITLRGIVTAAENGFIGKLTGNVTGNLTGNVTGNLTGDTAGKHTGAVDVRGKTLQLDNDQIPQSAIAGLAAALAAVLLPSGAIVAYGGLIADIPDGWSICDGTNATPDLRDKFIMGGAVDADVGVTGGALTHSHAITIENSGAHTHGITVEGTALTIAQMPAHNHGSGVCDQGTITWANHGQIPANPTTSNSVANDSNTGTAETLTTTAGSGQAHTHNASSTSSGVHNHPASSNAVNHVPPHMKLIYIMKD